MLTGPDGVGIQCAGALGPVLQLKFPANRNALDAVLEVTGEEEVLLCLYVVVRQQQDGNRDKVSSHRFAISTRRACMFGSFGCGRRAR